MGQEAHEGGPNRRCSGLRIGLSRWNPDCGEGPWMCEAHECMALRTTWEVYVNEV